MKAENIAMVMNGHPNIHRLNLGTLNLPDWHPRHKEGVSTLFAYVVMHSEGPILFDCGCGADNDFINALYSPSIQPVESALIEIGVRIEDLRAVVLSHLHFDHCGQLSKLRGVPTFVQGAELELIDRPNFTVKEWATIPPNDLRAVSGDYELATGVKLVSTPGHTPGHQSMVVTGDGLTTVIGGQCCYRHAGFHPNHLEMDNVFGPDWAESARRSLGRLRDFKPDRLLLAHD